MRLNEPDATKRRVGPIQCIDTDGNPVTSGFFGNTYLSINDGAFVSVARTIGVIGNGYVYCELEAGDVGTLGFVTVRIADICQETAMREEIELFPQGIPLNTVNPDDLHLGPLRIVDGTATPLPDMIGITTEISINGSAWDTPAGSFSVMTTGYVDYVPDATEVAETGWIAVRLSGACQETVFRTEISSLSGGAGAPVITAISPTPGVAPGDPGGFPDGRRTAIDTPIVISITDADPGLGYVLVTLRTFQDNDTNGHTELIVYRDGNFREPFLDSTQSGALTLSIVRDDGWTGLFLEVSVYAVDTVGNTASETFIYELPDTFELTVSPVLEGAVDHTAAALNRLPWQFRSESHVG
jgi:hypothetical protein